MNFDSRVREPGTRRRLPSQTSDDALSFPGAAKLFLRRRWTIFMVALVTTALIFTALIQAPQKYVAKSLVLIAPEQAQILAENGEPVAAPPENGLVDSELKTLRSPALIGRLVDRLKLADEPEWNPALRAPSLWSEAMKRAGLQREQSPATIRREVIKKVAHALNVDQQGSSYVLEITAVSEQPEDAAKIANAAVDLYLENQMAKRFAAAAAANDWLSQRLQILSGEIQQKEAALAAFRSARNMGAGRGGQDPEQQEKMMALKAARTEVLDNLARRRQLQDLVDAGAPASAIAEFGDSDVLRRLVAQEADITQRQTADPSAAPLRQERELATAQIRQAIAAIIEQSQKEVEAASARLNALEEAPAPPSGGIAAGSPAEQELKGLELELSAQRSVYQNLLQRYQDLIQTSPSQIDDSKQVAEAGVPAGSFSLGPAALLAMSMAVGAILGVGAGLLVENLDRGVRGAADSLRKTGRGALASIPLLRASDFKGLPAGARNPVNYILDKPLSAYSESLRNLRTGVLYSVQAEPPKTICVTASKAHEGKTTTALGLARISAMSGQATLIIDCDVRRRPIAKMLGLQPRYGLLDVVSGDAELTAAILKDGATGLHVLPAIEALYTPKNLFASPAMARLLGDVRAHYDLVVLNAPSIVGAGDARVIAIQADQTILVARWSNTPAGRIRKAIETLEESGAHVSGVAINFVNPRALGRLSPQDTAHRANYESRYYKS